MKVKPIAIFHSPLTSKFGVPRQSGLVEGLKGEIVFEPQYRHPEYIRGVEGFDFLWLLWTFSENKDVPARSTVRPPLLGGNVPMGVFATRSPYRPNPIGLSSVQIESIDFDCSQAPVIRVIGADLMDKTPILDIKPYLEYADSHVGIRSGFTDQRAWQCLDVVFEPSAVLSISPEEKAVLTQLLALDPRPHYHDDPERVYGMPFAGRDVHFRVAGTILTVIDIS